MQKDETWYESLVHEIEIATFNNLNDMKLLRNEIELFNRTKLIRNLMWLCRLETLIDKLYSSIKISFRSKIEWEKAMQKEIIIASKQLKTSKFFSIKSTDQCNKCQKFDHFSITCKQNFWTCSWCFENHETRLHACATCKSKETCSHISPKCSNCSQSHAANDRNCEHFRVLIIRHRSNQEDELWETKTIKRIFEFCSIIVQNRQISWPRVWNSQSKKSILFLFKNHELNRIKLSYLIPHSPA